MDYHGIVFDVSQKRSIIFATLNIIGRKQFLRGRVLAYKLSIRPERLEAALGALQSNLRRSHFLFPHGFYFHVYRRDKLVIVFKERRFLVTTNRATWGEAIGYGRHLGIPLKQLDFDPCRVEDESY